MYFKLLPSPPPPWHAHIHQIFQFFFLCVHNNCVYPYTHIKKIHSVENMHTAVFLKMHHYTSITHKCQNLKHRISPSVPQWCTFFLNMQMLECAWNHMTKLTSEICFSIHTDKLRKKTTGEMDNWFSFLMLVGRKDCKYSCFKSSIPCWCAQPCSRLQNRVEYCVCYHFRSENVTFNLVFDESTSGTVYMCQAEIYCK